MTVPTVTHPADSILKLEQREAELAAARARDPWWWRLARWLWTIMRRYLGTPGGDV